MMTRKIKPFLGELPIQEIEDSGKSKDYVWGRGTEMFQGALRRLDAYGQQASAHGVRYLFDLQLPWWHRVIWVVAFVASIFCFYILVTQSYNDWLSPPIITLAASPTRKEDFPFPAASLCGHWTPPPGTHSLLTQLDAQKDGEEKYQEYLTVKALCGLASEEEKRKIKNFSMIWTQSQMTVAVTEPTDGIPVAVFASPDEFCITANIAEEEILLQDADRFQFWLLRKPRAHFVEKELAFSLTRPKEVDEKCVTKSFKLNLIPHDPFEFPWRMHQTRLPSLLTPLKESVVTIDGDFVESTPDVEDLPLKSRQCYYPGERTLDLFREYTPDNCVLECLVKQTVRRHDCKPYWLPGPKGVKVCSSEIDISLEDLPKGPSTPEPCDCARTCNDTRYTPSDATLLRDNKDSTGCRISFKHSEIQTKIRSVKATVTSFLANCAGFLGMFLGISVLSVFEILYQFFSTSCCTKKDDSDLEATYLEIQREVHLLSNEIADMNVLLHDVGASSLAVKLNSFLGPLGNMHVNTSPEYQERY